MATSSVAVGLGSVNMLVVCGNLFVLYLLISQRSLHSATNLIVLSLTLSDCLLGVLILPFSIIQEYSHAWYFGEDFCRIWLALDVFFSTASIYNLLGISFDRYRAVHSPLNYKFISAGRSTRVTIASVWLIAAAIALPPLALRPFELPFNIAADVASEAAASFRNTSAPTNFAAAANEQTLYGECTPMKASNGYILFSAFVSFIFPMCSIIILNVSIFRVVANSTRLTKIAAGATCGAVFLPSARNGYTTSTTTSAHAAVATNAATTTLATADMCMRVHRGGAKMSLSSRASAIGGNQTSRRASSSSSKGATMTMAAVQKKRSLVGVSMHRIDETAKIAANVRRTPPTIVSRQQQTLVETDEETTTAAAAAAAATAAVADTADAAAGEASALLDAATADSSPPLLSRPSTTSVVIVEMATGAKTSPRLFQYPSAVLRKSVDATSAAANDRVSPFVAWWRKQIVAALSLSHRRRHRNRSRSNDAKARQSAFLYGGGGGQPLLATTVVTTNSTTPPLPLPSPTANTARNVSNLRTELRVARTIGIVVGCFVASWLPFSIIYLLQAYDTCTIPNCVPNWLFTFAFWLGYSNSAVNPLLYAVCSRQLRSTIRRVLFERISASMRSS